MRQSLLSTCAIVFVGDAGWTGFASNAYGSGAAFGYEAGWGTPNGAPVFDLAFQTFVTSNGATPPPTSTAAATSTPGNPAPLPLLFALTASAMVAVVVLTKRYGVVTRR